MKKYLFKFLNPINWLKARTFHKQHKQYDRSTYDLELHLYSKILRTDMLHWGYFEQTDVNPETLSIQDIEKAQMRYAEKIIGLINDKEHSILDVGCGMGGLSAMMRKEGLKPEALTPNRNQIEYIQTKYPQIPTYKCKFEQFDSNQKYGTIINSESLQYIKLDDAFQQIDRLLTETGRWIIVDYFRTAQNAKNKSGHRIEDFKAKLNEKQWKIIQEEDITANVLPTIGYVKMYADRFLFPLKHFAFEKLRYKLPWLYFMLQDLKQDIDQKIHKEMLAVDPAVFANEKKYILFVVER